MNISLINMKLLKDLINRGFLRIFPFPQKVIVGLTFIGCGSTKQVTLLVTDIRHDTIYVSNNQFDSIYVYENKLIDRSRDTIYIRDKSIEFRYR